MKTLRRRVVQLVPVMFVVSILTFLMLDLLPGDPTLAILGEGASDDAIANLREELRLDEPVHVRYVAWIGDVMRGDLGRSVRTGQPVLDSISTRLPISLELMVLAQGIALILAVPMAVVTAYRAGSRLDRMMAGVSFGMISLPHFVIGIVFILLFAVQLGWLPATGWVRISDDLVGNLRTAFLPAVTLSLNQIAIYHRLLRTDMVTTLQEDFVNLARSKGLSTPYILFRHALRPSSFSLVTLAGVNIGRLIGGAVVVEFLFAIPGIGQLIVQSIAVRDFVMVQGVVLFTAVTYVIVNALVDLSYAILDPRVRHGS